MAFDVTTLRGRVQESLRVTAGPLADVFAAQAHAAERAAGGLYQRDPEVWSNKPDEQKKIANRLGWMSSPQLMARSIDRLQRFADGVRLDGFNDVVLLGMGGSSLAPEVLRAVLGVTPGWPRFQMLDSTDPAAVRAAATPPDRTLYVLASKSGTTIEPNSLAAHFRRTLVDAGVTNWASRFVAITDEDTELDRRARADGFRDVFINPSDIGGRYSALSFFGMVPSVLMGQDIEAIVEWGLAMQTAAEPGFGDAHANPAVALGLAIGAGASAGRDKMTLVLPPSLEAFGLWVEQLIAESTGKNSVGIVPIAGEPVGAPEVYGNDRLFVRARLKGTAPDMPVPPDSPRIDIELPEAAALGAEFVRWEIATAVAGALLKINPFDEPNVQEAKTATRKLLDLHTAEGRFPASKPDFVESDGAQLTLSASARRYVANGDPESFLTVLRQGDYFGLLAYLPPDEALEQELQALRRAVRDRARVATMFGFGPRYLHSTGQLHKGGPNTGVFLLITAEPREDLDIPGEPFSFGTLESAQGLGDFQSLDAGGRRALHAHLPAPDAALIRALGETLLARRQT